MQAVLRPSPVGIGLALLGALGMIISVFLPRVESTTFSFGGVAENTLIQSGEGWILLGLAAGVVGATYRNYQYGSPGWTVIALGGLAIAYAAYLGTSDDLLTLYPLDESGEPDPLAEGEVAKPGIGIYVAGVGGALAAFGGWQQRTLESTGSATSPRGATPRAAESTIDELERLQQLHEGGVLTTEQFETQKERVLRREE